MNDELLKWKTVSSRLLLHTPVFDVSEQDEVSATGIEGKYVAVSAVDWVVVVPVYRDCFVMVRQWRHAADRLTTEFPGGVMNAGEDPVETARRELLEETGFRAGKMTLLGSCSPNPALFKNRFYCFLAEDMEPTGSQELDGDELLEYELVPIEKVTAEFGSDDMTHAFMGTALAFWFRHIGFVPGGK